MSEDSKIKSNGHKTNLREQTTGNLMEASFQLKCKFTNVSYHFLGLLKGDLEQEHKRLMDNLIEKHDEGRDLFIKIDEEYLQKIDFRINELIKYHNSIDEIINTYDRLFQLLKIQNTIIENALNGRIISDEEFSKEFLNLNY
jgi:hypothetical protein